MVRVMKNAHKAISEEKNEATKPGNQAFESLVLCKNEDVLSWQS
jgi:hypothetical protein